MVGVQLCDLDNVDWLHSEIMSWKWLHSRMCDWVAGWLGQNRGQAIQCIQ